MLFDASSESYPLLQRFVRSWELKLEPAVEPFLLPSGHQDFIAHALKLCRTDVEFRVLAGEGVPVIARYLAAESFGSDWKDDHWVKLAELELRCHWGAGNRIAPEEYCRKLPACLRDRLAHVEVRWSCKKECRRRDSTISDFQADNATCPSCGTTAKLEELFPTAAAPWDASSNAPRWLCERLVDAPKLGEGGYGDVYRIKDKELDDRDVAVKILKPEHKGNGKAKERFDQECNIIAHLQHPNITPIHRKGILPDGQPYYMMKRIEGEHFDELIEKLRSYRRKLSGGGDVVKKNAQENCREAAEAAIKAFEAVAQAVAFAHSQHLPIIHCDLKPNNVRIGKHGEVFLLDWGIAKYLEQADPEQRVSKTSDKHGTWPYIAPEQARGEVVRPAADVFSLGSILCEILTGEPAWGGKEASVEEIQTRAKQADVTAALHRLVELKNDELWGTEKELIDLCSKLLVADPRQRLADGNDVMEHLELWRHAKDNRAREAAAADAREKEAVKTAQAEKARADSERKRRILAWTLSGLALLAATALSYLLYINVDLVNEKTLALDDKTHALDEKTRALLDKAAALEREKLALDDKTHALDEKKRALLDKAAALEREKKANQTEQEARKREQEANEVNRQQLVRLNVEEGTRSLNRKDFLGAIPWFAEALRLDRRDQDREWVHRLRLATMMSQCPQLIHVDSRSGLPSLSWSSSGSRMVIGGVGPIKVWNAIDGSVREIPDTNDDEWNVVCSPTEPIVAISGRSHIRLIHVDSLMDVLKTPKVRSKVVQFSPDGKRLLVIAKTRKSDLMANEVWIIDWEETKETGPIMIDKKRIAHAEFDAHGERVLVVWNDVDFKLPKPNEPLKDCAEVNLYQSNSGDLVKTMSGNGHATFSPDGKSIAAVTVKGVKIVDCTDKNAEPLIIADRQSPVIQHVRFSPDGRRLLILDPASGTSLRVWKIVGSGEKRVARVDTTILVDSTIEDAVFTPDSTAVVTMNRSGGDLFTFGTEIWSATIWNAETGKAETPPLTLACVRSCMAVAPRGQRLAVASDGPAGGLIKIWDFAGARISSASIMKTKKGGAARGQNQDEVSLDARYELRIDPDGSAALWDLEKRMPTGSLLRQPDKIQSARFSPYGGRLATWGEREEQKKGITTEIQIWRVPSGKKAHRPLLIDGAVKAVAFLATENELLVVPAREKPFLVDLATEKRKVLARPAESLWWDDHVTGVTLDQESGRIATWGNVSKWLDEKHSGVDRKHFVRLWDSRSGQEVGQPLFTDEAVEMAVLAKGGNLLLTSTRTGSDTQLWNLKAGRRRGPRLPHHAPLQDAIFSPDSKLVATLAGKVARCWDTSTGNPLTPPLVLLAHDPRWLRFDCSGRLLLAYSGHGLAAAWDSTTGQVVLPIDRFASTTLIVDRQNLPLVPVDSWHPASNYLTRFDHRLFHEPAQVWPGIADKRNIEEITKIATLLSGRRVDQTGFMIVSPAEQLQLWRDLKNLYPQEFTPSTAQPSN